MKKLVFSLTPLFLFINLSAQKLKDAQIPSAVRTSFQKQYPGLQGKWDKEDNNYEVSFQKDGKAMSLVIQNDGTIVETETVIPISDLPSAALSFMKSRYNHNKIKEAARIIKGNGEVNYEAEINKRDILFDANGKFLKEARD
jgi:hypothetical protein